MLKFHGDFSPCYWVRNCTGKSPDTVGCRALCAAILKGISGTRIIFVVFYIPGGKAVQVVAIYQGAGQVANDITCEAFNRFEPPVIIVCD